MTYPVDPFGEPSEEGMGGVSARSEVGVGEHKAPQDQASEFEAYRTAEGARAAPPIAIEDADSLGSAFKAARFASGRSLAELSDITRVPTRYLTALEDGRLADLPSRPFALGHARAYAQHRSQPTDAEAAYGAEKLFHPGSPPKRLAGTHASRRR